LDGLQQRTSANYTFPFLFLREYIRKIASFKDYTTICSSAPSECLAIEGLRAKNKVPQVETNFKTCQLLNRNREVVLENLRLLDKFFTQYNKYFSWERPTAGTIGFPKLNVNVDVEKFAEDLRSKKGVLLLPR
jgi:aspartate/methionine/tyrosine aminotransferase